MTPAKDEQPVVKDAAWQAWLEQGRRNDRATARNFKVVGGILLLLLVVAIAFYSFSAK